MLTSADQLRVLLMLLSLVVVTGSAAITTTIICNGGAATITLTGVGGTGAISYTFNGVTNATGIFAGIPAGVAYPWSITDVNLCGPVTGTLDCNRTNSSHRLRSNNHRYCM